MSFKICDILFTILNYSLFPKITLNKKRLSKNIYQSVFIQKANEKFDTSAVLKMFRFEMPMNRNTRVTCSVFHALKTGTFYIFF